MDLKSLISEKNVLVNLEVADRPSLYVLLAEHLVKEGCIPQDLQKTVLDGLEAREKKMSTAIGEGIALPHASIDGLPGVVALVAQCKKGIDCNAPDEQPVDFFFTILVPLDQYSLHLQTLAAVARFLNQPGIKEKLRSATTAGEIVDIF